MLEISRAKSFPYKFACALQSFAELCETPGAKSTRKRTILLLIVLYYLITKKRITTSSTRSSCLRQLFPLSTTMRTGYYVQPVIYIKNQKEKGFRLSHNTQLSRFSQNILIKTEKAGAKHFRSITFSQLVFFCDHMAWCVVTGLLC